MPSTPKLKTVQSAQDRTWGWDPSWSGEAGRDSAGPSGLTRDGLSCSVLLRVEEPIGTSGRQHDGHPCESLMTHAIKHTFMGPTVTHSSLYIHPRNTPLPSPVGAPLPPQKMFSLIRRHSSCKPEGKASRHGRGEGEAHSWMMGASCVPRSSQ